MTNIDVSSLVPVGEPNPFAVAFVTLGCAKNEVDTAAMVERASAAGFTVCEDPEDAQAVVVNTCSFIQEATEESLQTIFELSGLDGYADGSKHVVVAGCMPARYGEDLERDLSEAAAFVPCSKEDDIAGVLRSLLGDPLQAAGANPAADESRLRDARRLVDAPARYVKISDGCDRFCSFCAIPYIRGRYHSFPYESIRQQVASLVDAGTREITLIAQDTGRWGADFEPADATAHLLERLADEFPATWFRLMYVEPVGVTDELLDVIATHENVCSYLDVPLQHASQRILRAMNRSGSAKQHLELVERIRKRVPGITLRTTLIAGFPGETEDEFQELVDFVEEAEFDYVGVFAYSREEGTKAASLPDQIDEETKQERAQTLRDVADSISYGRVASRVGSQMDVLLLGFEEDGQLFGRAMCQAPEVDGVTYVERGEVGDIVSVTVSDTLLYEMEGE